MPHGATMYGPGNSVFHKAEALVIVDQVVLAGEHHTLQSALAGGLQTGVQEGGRQALAPKVGGHGQTENSQSLPIGMRISRLKNVILNKCFPCGQPIQKAHRHAIQHAHQKPLRKIGYAVCKRSAGGRLCWRKAVRFDLHQGIQVSGFGVTDRKLVHIAACSFPYVCYNTLQNQLEKTQDQLETVESDDTAAHDVDDAQDLIVEPGGEAGNEDSDAEEPQKGSGGGAQDQLGADRAGIARPEAAEEHGAVDQGLRVKPGDHAGLGGHPRQRDVHLYRLIHGGLVTQQADADPHHGGSARQQDDKLQPGKALHQRADAEKAGQRQSHIKKHHDQGGEQGPPSGLGQGGVVDKQILHPNGGHVGQSDGQALEIRRHDDSS